MIQPDLTSVERDAGQHPMERRMVLKLLTHWRGLAGDRSMPSRRDLDPGSLDDIVRPKSFLLSVPADSDVIFQFIGEELAAEAGRDFVGQSVAAVPRDTLLGRAASYYPTILTKRVPISLGGDFRSAEGMLVLYRSIILPLSDGGERIEALIGAANCRVVAKT